MVRRRIETQVDVIMVKQTDVIRTKAEDASPQMARDLADAFALEFISWRREANRKSIKEAKSIIEQQVGTYTSEEPDANQSILNQKLEDLKIAEVLQTGDVKLRVIILEADLHLPTLAEKLGLDDSLGLTNVLAGNCSLREVLQMADVRSLAARYSSNNAGLRGWKHSNSFTAPSPGHCSQIRENRSAPRSLSKS